MYSTKILKYLFFFVGVIISLIGCFMKLNGYTSTGTNTNKYGTVSQPITIDGNSTIIIGFILLASSLIAQFVYLSEKKQKKMLRKKDVKIKTEKTINFYKNPTKYQR